MNIKTGLIAILLMGSSLNALAAELSDSGSINFMQTKGYAKTKNITFTIDNNINGVLRLYYSPVKNKNIIRGEFIVNNTNAKKTDLRYRIVFKDKIGAIAQSKGNMILNQGKNQKVKFGSIVLTKEDLKNINSYDIKIHQF